METMPKVDVGLWLKRTNFNSYFDETKHGFGCVRILTVEMGRTPNGGRLGGNCFPA